MTNIERSNRRHASTGKKVTINGAQILLQSLKAEGVTTIFGYPGGMVIDVFDALWYETSPRTFSSYSSVTNKLPSTLPTAMPELPASPAFA